VSGTGGWRSRATPVSAAGTGGWRSRAVAVDKDGWSMRDDGVRVRNVPQNGPKAPSDATTISDTTEQTTPIEALIGSADLTDLGKRGSALISAARGRGIERDSKGHLREAYPAMVAPLMSSEGISQRAGLYSQNVDTLRGHYGQAKEEHPGASFAGAVGPMLPLGAIGLGGSMLLGGGASALQSKHNPFDNPYGYAKDVTLGTMVGMGGHYGGKAIGATAAYGARKVGDFMEYAAGRPSLSKVIPKDFGLTFGREIGEGSSKGVPPAILAAAKVSAQNIDTVPGAVNNSEAVGSLSGLLGRAMRFDTEGMNTQAEGLIMKHGPKIDRALKNIGLDAPTPEKWVSRDFDITQAMRSKLRQKNLTGVAEDVILKHPEYQNVRTGEDKVRLVDDALESTGKKISEFVSKFDARANRGQRFNPEAVAEKIEREVLRPLNQYGSKLDESAVNAVQSQVDALRSLGKQGLSFDTAFNRIRQLDKHLKWDSGVSTPTRDALRQVRGIMKGETESAVEDIAISSGDLGMVDEWKKLKTQYGALSEFSEMASKRLLDARDGNRFFSLTDNIWGAGALATAPGIVAGSPTAALTGAAGVVGMAGAKWARERGPQMMALSLQKHGWEAVQKAATENPNSLGPFAQAIQREISRGGAPAALALHNALISRSPEYAQRVIGLAEESAKQSLAR
jgi:hypothetical protein